MDSVSCKLSLDEHGVCQYCHHHDALLRLFRVTPKSESWLAKYIAEIRAEGKGKAYDCIVGVSGGVDSTFAAYKAKQLGLRPLAVHFDNCWNTELAVGNIEQTLKRLDIELYTHVVDWEEFRDLQVSFLRASVSDAEIPTDHAIWAVLYHVAAQEGIRHIVTGLNIASEGLFPDNWTYGAWDWKYIRGVHRRFGTVPLRQYPHRTMKDVLNAKIFGEIRELSILNHVPYVKKDAMCLLERELGWRPYGGKHYESVYTRFFQGYILPRKFKIDKRTAHLSTLIGSGQMTRQDALEQLERDPYPSAEQLAIDKEFVLKKLQLESEEFERIMALPRRTFRDYPNNAWYLKKHVVGTWLRRLRLRGRRAA